MGYMSVKDENFPRAQGVLRGKLSKQEKQIRFLKRAMLEARMDKESTPRCLRCFLCFIV